MATYRQRVRCKAVRSSDGNPCQRWAIYGGDVCASHGGRAPQVRAAAARREAERKAMASLSREGIEPVQNPLTAFAALAGECVRLKDYLGERVERLEELRYRSGAGEQQRAELVAYGAALDRTIRVLEAYGRLGVDERLARVSEAQVAVVASAVERVFSRVGLAGEPSTAVKQFLAAVLRNESADAGLESRLDDVRRQVTALDRVADLERELAESRSACARLADALRNRGSGPLAIGPAPAPVDALSALLPPVGPSEDDEVVDAEIVDERPFQRRDVGRWGDFSVRWHEGA